MGPKSLRSKLLAAVSCLVIGSGLLISVLVTQRYTESLLSAVTAQADSLGHAIALEAAEKVLLNDRVALQKMLDHQMRSNPSLAYLFVLRDGKILAHTFGKGVPTELIDANEASSEDLGHMQQIASTKDERYLDIAWPIFSGRAGVLRLGFPERPFREQVTALWLQMTMITIGILFLAVVGSLIFVRRITNPLSMLAIATKRVDQGDLDATVDIQGQDEVAALASAFNHMVSRVKDYTLRLENKAEELERTHNQTRTFCEIIREIGALPTLREIGPALIKRFQQILICREMALLVLNEDWTSLYVLSESDLKVVKDAETIRLAGDRLARMDELTFLNKPALVPPVVPSFFQTAAKQAVVPFASENQILGGLVLACPEQCHCDLEEVEVIGLTLTQAAGVIRRAMLHEEATSDLRAKIEASAEFCGIVGKNPKMQVVYRLIEDIAPTDVTVLIQGESGTGKELVARAIHEQSERKSKSFVVINCSAYPETLLESELFGHEKGAFTGAIRQKAGRFEQADGGTVFLDEIGEIPPQAQIKLLRVLQTQRFERLGGERSLNVDVRILAATNKDLLREVQKGHFREDLFYRLNVIPIFLPPLRDRLNDIPLLAGYFLNRFAVAQSKVIHDFSPEAMRKILDYPWPGNVRELENSVEHAVTLAKGSRIETADLPAAIRGSSMQASSSPLIEENERALLERVLTECNWEKKRTARRLGMGRSTLYTKLKKYRIMKPTLQ
jgi:transcriptional regulator with GAF, ATPase, and Fis domain/HAMP domain-containing protein